MIRELKQTRFMMACLCMLSSLLLSSCVESFPLPEFMGANQGYDYGDGEEDEDYGSNKQKPKPVRKIKLSPPKKVISEKLLDAEGRWYISENSQSYDPAKAHLKARNSVNVKRRKTKKNLSAHFKPDAQSGEDGTLRILRLERKDGVGLGSDSSPEYDVAQSIITSPDSIINEPSFDETKGHGYANGVMITPPPLPERKVFHIFVEKKNAEVKIAVNTAVSQSDDLGGDVVGSELESGIIIPRRKPLMKGDIKWKPIVKNVGSVDAKAVVEVKKISKAKPVKAKAGATEIEVVDGVPIPPVKPKLPKKRSVVLTNTGSAGVLGNPSLVSKLRTGINSGKVRVVIEVSYATKYKVAIDPLRNVLRVKMDNTLWDIGTKGNIKGSSLLGTYIVRERKDGSSLFEVRLKKKAKIVKTMVLRPYKKSGYRIVIDMKPL